jgi:hypothetical protein
MSQRTSTLLEVISAVAVILSLIFVAFEIRNSSEQVEQNTRALQITAYQDLVGRIVEINAIGIEESTTIESLVAIESPTEHDTRKLNSFLWILFRHGDMAFFQYEQGAITKERLRSVMAPINGRLELPKVVARWQEIQDVFVPSYRAYVQKQIDRIQKQHEKMQFETNS